MEQAPLLKYFLALWMLWIKKSSKNTILNNKQQTLHHVMANQLKILNIIIAHIDKLEKVTGYNTQLLFNITTRINSKIAKQDLKKEMDEYFLTLNTIITDILQEIVLSNLTFDKKQAKQGILRSYTNK